MTEKIFYKDNLLKQLNTFVKSCKEGKSFYEVILDKTIFYPEGGGQPADFGFIDGKKVVDVQNLNGEIIHFVEGKIEKKEVLIELDFERRFDLMQQHTGQHLLSEVLMKLYNVQTLSFHLGDDYSTIEISMETINEQTILEIEKEIMKKIYENLKIKTYFVENVTDVPFRKMPKVKSNIRVVEIDKYDYNACGGIHLNSTGQLGMVKIIKSDKIRGNVRLYFVCGNRALLDYSKKQQNLGNLMKELSATPDEIVTIVDKLRKENYQLKKDLKTYKTNIFKTKLNELLKLPVENICDCFVNAEIKDLREMANMANKKNKNVIFYSDEFAVISICKENDKFDIVSSEIFNLFKGKGGGSGNMKQGKVGSLEKIEQIKNIWESFGK